MSFLIYIDSNSRVFSKLVSSTAFDGIISQPPLLVGTS
jgi:hypothetical protein